MRTEPIVFFMGLLATGPLAAEEPAEPPRAPAEQRQPPLSGSPQPRPPAAPPAPAPGFTPSERIKADQSVAFPVDI